MPLPLLVLSVVLALIAVRRVGPLRLAIWQIMCAGAIVVLVGGAKSPADALLALDWDVMLFLFGVFVVGGRQRLPAGAERAPARCRRCPRCSPPASA
jgi:Na+/H+ antiporter NhaD/arsenite permease-like protein